MVDYYFLLHDQSPALRSEEASSKFLRNFGNFCYSVYTLYPED